MRSTRVHQARATRVGIRRDEEGFAGFDESIVEDEEQDLESMMEPVVERKSMRSPGSRMQPWDPARLKFPMMEPGNPEKIQSKIDELKKKRPNNLDVEALRKHALELDRLRFELEYAKSTVNKWVPSPTQPTTSNNHAAPHKAGASPKARKNGRSTRSSNG